ncbi:MAG TPA: hypothetical protein VGC99_13955 [Candidatus Tectomicrobia bacterium]
MARPLRSGHDHVDELWRDLASVTHPDGRARHDAVLELQPRCPVHGGKEQVIGLAVDARVGFDRLHRIPGWGHGRHQLIARRPRLRHMAVVDVLVSISDEEQVVRARLSATTWAPSSTCRSHCPQAGPVLSCQVMVTLPRVRLRMPVVRKTATNSSWPQAWQLPWLCCRLPQAQHTCCGIPSTYGRGQSSPAYRHILTAPAEPGVVDLPQTVRQLRAGRRQARHPAVGMALAALDQGQIQTIGPGLEVFVGAQLYLVWV